MRKPKLSVITIAKDAEEILQDCFRSVKWADEIVIVVDDRTMDNTEAIAKKFTRKVYLKKFKNFGDQCQFALSKATGDWVLKLDTDERITPELKKEILKKIQSTQFSGYHAFFQPVFWGKEFRRSNVRIQGTVRLFRRTKTKFLPLAIHEMVEVKGKVGTLRNEIVHHCFRTISQTLDKFNNFSNLEAKQLYQAGGRTNILFMTLAPIHIFIRRFFLEKNYRNGIHGFIYSLLFAQYYLIKHLKIWELMLKKEDED